MKTVVGSIIARDLATYTPLTRGESVGLVFDMMAGIASTLASVVILVLICVSLITQSIQGLLTLMTLSDH
jgi:hypothetical protein